MIGFIISAIKIVFLLGFLIFIHEGGHFLIAKLCKIRVNEFSIGFGPTIWTKQTKETKYSLRIIPLGGFVSMEGEEEASDKEGSFSKASIPRRIAVVLAGPIVNIIFAFIVYFLIVVNIGIEYSDSINVYVEGNTFLNSICYAIDRTQDFGNTMIESIKYLITGNLTVDDMMGPVGISEVVASTSGIREFIYIMAVISLSLGVTNLLPIPALDGGKFVLLVIEAIRRKPLKQETEITIQLLGFSFIIALSLYVTYNDILRII